MRTALYLILKEKEILLLQELEIISPKFGQRDVWQDWVTHWR